MSIDSNEDGKIRMHLNEIQPPLDYTESSVLSRYGEVKKRQLSERITKDLRVGTENIVFESGADGCLRLIFSYLKDLGFRFLIPENSYPGFVEILSKLGIEYDLYSTGHLKDKFSSLGLLAEKTCVVACNPNNPTGSLHNSDIQDAVELGAFLVVDESYIEFAEDLSVVEDIMRWNRVVCIRSFSKVLCAPSLRLGYIVAHQDLCGRLRQFQCRYPMSEIVFDIAQEIWIERHQFIESAKKLNQVAQLIIKKLRDRGFEAIDTATHFFIFRDRDEKLTQEVWAHFLNNNCLLRKIKLVDESIWIRVGLGKKEDADRFMSILEKCEIKLS